MERFPFFSSVLGTLLRSWIYAARVSKSLTIAKDLGRKAEPFLLTSTSHDSVSERDFASSKR